MSYGGASDEVAEDFKLALEDLTMNSRYEISNLTVIAKENTEHALAISEALKEHIKKVGQFQLGGRLARCHLFLNSVILSSLSCILTLFTDRSSQEATSIVSPRFHCQERRNPIHTFLRSPTLHDIHGILRLG